MPATKEAPEAQQPEDASSVEQNVSRLRLDSVQGQRHGRGEGGHTATEEVVDFVKLWNSGPEQFRQSLQQRLREAEEFHYVEQDAATTIQRHFRGSVVRARILLQCYAAMEIQRCFRGFSSRKQCYDIILTRDRERLAYFRHLCAVMIQRIFRGYRSRRHVHDFYARRSYIFEVTEKGEELRKSLRDSLQEQIENKLVNEEEKAMEEFDKVTQHLHHLMSTKTQSGVFNPQYAEHPDQIPSSFNVPIEDHLHRGVKRYLRTRGLRTGSAFQTSDRSPRSYAGSSETVRISSPYEAEKEKQKLEKRLSELQQISSQPYRPTSRPEDLKPYRTIRSSSSFEEPWKLARSTREFENAPENITKRVGYPHQPYFISSNKTDRVFEDLERERVKSQNSYRQLQSSGLSHSRGTPKVDTANTYSSSSKHRSTVMSRHGRQALNPALPQSVRKQSPKLRNTRGKAQDIMTTNEGRELQSFSEDSLHQS
eukprot:gb/GECG01012008.1/.p1 GENE.gb/GECG01012008.1/~~gb/GECG01012008.1/.p1  ORF type:complete len:481 (+),score=50.66 gb/GECG01012008.1/:1-1443(+)